MKELIEIIVTKDKENERIDKLISDETELSRMKAKELIESKAIYIKDKEIKPNYRVKENDFIIVEVPDDEVYEIEPVFMDLDIVYEDDDCLVVNKPSGLVVHPSSTSKEPTLVHGLMAQIKNLSGINGIMRPGIVHRIDKDTSGLLMVAKSDLAHNSLVNQLVEKTTTRKYIALVYGEFEHTNGKITAPIGRDPNDRKKMAVVENGKHAITHFKVLEKYDGFSLIECRLETGRTHQIRVHMKYIGHPLVGDPLYGPKKIIGDHGQFLHAKIIGFKHPKTNEYLEFDSELPDYFINAIEELRKNGKIS